MKEITFRTFSDGTVVLEVIQGKIERLHQTLKKWCTDKAQAVSATSASAAPTPEHVLMLIHDTAVTISDTGTGRVTAGRRLSRRISTEKGCTAAGPCPLRPV
jgi:hypothetical protein